MIHTLITNIAAVLNGIAQLKKVYMYPIGQDQRIEAYPAAICIQDSFDNAFESTEENRKHYRFKLWIVIGCEKDTVANVFADALPKTVDAVVAAFDTAWNGGTIGGHRVRYLISNGSATLSENENAREATAELTVDIQTLTGI